MRMRINRAEIPAGKKKEPTCGSARPGDVFYFKGDESKITYMMIKNTNLAYVDLQTGELYFVDEENVDTPIYIYPAPELRLTEFTDHFYFSSME